MFIIFMVIRLHQYRSWILETNILKMSTTSKNGDSEVGDFMIVTNFDVGDKAIMRTNVTKFCDD